MKYWHIFWLGAALALLGAAVLPAAEVPKGFILSGTLSRTMNTGMSYEYSMGPALRFLTNDPSIRQQLELLADKNVVITITPK